MHHLRPSDRPQTPKTRASAMAAARSAEDVGRGTPLRLLLAGGALALAVLALQVPMARAQDAADDASGAAGEAGTEGETIISSHGYSFFGDLKYPADYAHFDYVDPDAPQGGEMALSATGTFDSLNPYTVKGRAGAGASMMYESLLAPAADEYGTGYCLLCTSLEYDEGKNWVIFHLRDDVTFSDGTPMTAEDVIFTHDLFLEQGLPSYSAGVSRILTGAEVIDPLTVKYTFAPDISRRSLIDQVGGTPVFSKAWYEETGARLDESRLITSPGTGPYMLDSYDVNRRIVYKRNPDYWGNDLPINVGRWNFDTIRYEYFGEENSAFEGFKAGEYTFREETSSRQWASQYNFPAVQDGHVKLEELPDGNPPGAAGFVFNLGKEKFADVRVRAAIALAFNFEWTNESLQYGLFDHRESYFQDTPLQAEGLPGKDEQAILDQLGDLVPDALRNEAPRGVHESSADRLNDRRNLRRASQLLEEAGWTVDSSGVRRNAQGRALTIDFPISSASSSTIEGILQNYGNNLDALGISLNIDKVDPSQFTDRRRTREYDMIYGGYSSSLTPGTGLTQKFGSDEAEFSVFNPAGYSSELMDQAIELALQTDTLALENASMKVLDRILRDAFLMVPSWYKAGYWVAYFDQYGHPEIPPYDLGYLDFWWYDADKAADLRAAGALR